MTFSSLIECGAMSRRYLLFLTAMLACTRSEEHTSELQSQSNLVCRLLLEKKKHHNSLRNFRCRYQLLHMLTGMCHRLLLYLALLVIYTPRTLTLYFVCLVSPLLSR